MIQFNLLPDVKLKYLKTQAKKRVVVISSLAASAVSLALLIVLFISVQVVQKNRLTKMSDQINSQLSTLNATPDLNKILTIQNQLKNLPQLHNDKPVVSRLFGYMQQITPVNANISSLNVDFVGYKMTIAGTADSLITGNKYADTLKFATYTTSSGVEGKPFSNVVTTMSAGSEVTDFSIQFDYDKILFESQDEPSLTVPNIISTRSETEKPSTIFKEQEKAETKEGQ